MKTNQIIEAIIYGDLNSEWKWAFTVLVIGSGLFLLWALYNTVLFKLTWRKEGNNKIEIDTPNNYRADEEIVIPLTGRLLAIDKVPDAIFSQKMVGDGFAIEPTKGTIYSPINGQVMQIYSNRDAITFKTNSKRNVILHIGLDSSNLKGEGITYYINEGDQVYAGQKIGDIDLEVVLSRVFSLVSPIVFPDLEENEKITLSKTGNVLAGEKNIVMLKMSDP